MPAATRQETTTGLIAFGSNQGNSMQVFQASIEALQKTAHISVSSHSQPIWTEPVTGIADSLGSPPATPTQTDKNPYLNAVIRIDTQLSPSELHLQTAAIEYQLGRVRSGRWQARVIDLDLLLLGDHIVDTESLTLPHPRMSFRRFVLEPAAEIAAELTHPLAKCSIEALLERINAPNKIMALVCPTMENQTPLLDQLVLNLSKIDPQWRFEKVFSKEKFLELDSNLTVVAVFDFPLDGNETQWRDLKACSLGFAGPRLHLKTPPQDVYSLTELSAALQAISR